MLPQYDEGMQNPGIARFGHRHEVSGRIDQPNASHVIGRARRPADMGWSDVVAMRRTSKPLLGQLDPGHLGNQRVQAPHVILRRAAHVALLAWDGVGR